MFNRIRLRFRDIKTISKLISGADEQAHLNGDGDPGAEHFLLSAFNLPDGSARRVFERTGADPDHFHAAIKKQYNDALCSIGIDEISIESDPEPVNPTRTFINAKPSGQAFMKALYALKKKDRDIPLLGAHVVGVVAGMEHGIAARALRAMGVDLVHISRAVKEELQSFHK